MKLSFERLQQIILEETIKLLQENEVSARAVDKITGVSRGSTARARSANLQRVMTSAEREAQRAAKDVAGRQAAQAARQAALKTAREGAAKVTQQYGLKGSERLITVKLLQKYPALINSPERLVKLVRPAAAAITGPAAASAATTALAAGGKSALRTALANAIRGAFTAGLAGGPVGLLAGLVTQTAAVLAYQYLQKGARENKERIRDTIVRVIHKNARNVTSMERRRLKAFIRGMGDAKEVREEFPQLLDKAKAQLSLANAREAERKRKEQEMYAGAEEFETQAMADQADADYAAQQAQLDDYEQQQAAMEDPLMSTEPGLDPADGVADLRPPVVPADGKKTKRRRVGSLARKARIQRRLNTKIGRSMEQVQAAVGAEETGRYDRDTYNKIVAWQKANLPATRISRGKRISNYDGLVGPVTFRKMMDQGMGALKKAGAGMLDRSTTARSQSELDRAKDRMDQSKKLLDDYLKSMTSMQSKLTPEDGEEIRQGVKQFQAQADEDRKEYLALKKKADAERVAQKRRGATKRIASRTKNIEKSL